MGQVKLEQIIAPNAASSNAKSTDGAALVAIDTSSLSAESRDILNQIIVAENQTDTKDLTYLFVNNQNKKTMVRLDSLNNLQDKLVGLLSERVTERPDEISNQELMQATKIVQDLIDRGTKSITEPTEKPVIQINTQTNNIGTLDGMPRESKDRVRNAVMSLLNSIGDAAAQGNADDIIDQQDGEDDE